MPRLSETAQAVIYYQDQLYDRWGCILDAATIVAVGNGTLAHTMDAGMVKELGELYRRCPFPLVVKCDAAAERLCICQTVPAVNPRQIEVCAESLRRALLKIGIKAITSLVSPEEIKKFRRSF